MLLPLVTPVGSNFIKDFPNQNEVNVGLIDAYSRASLTTHPLPSYSPIFSTPAGSPAVGTGGPAVLRAFYYEIFDQVHVWGEFRFGTSGANSGSGIWSMSLPFPALNTTGIGSDIGARPVIGAGSIWCEVTPANRQPVTVHLASTTTLQFSVKLASGAAQREIVHNAPILWAPQDGLNWYACYQRIAS
jgi:hypothetical protein